MPTWACSLCSFLNSATASACTLCGSVPSAQEKKAMFMWTCSVCTFINTSTATTCNVCNNVAPVQTKETTAKQPEKADEAKQVDTRDEAEQAWYKRKTTGIGTCRICPTCRGSSTSFCECAHQKFLADYMKPR